MCEGYFQGIAEAVCSCGRPITGKPRCQTCEDLIIIQNQAAFLYEGMAQEVILKLKYGKQPDVARGMATLMLTALGTACLTQADLVIPIPIHKKRLRTRGFNQADLLAKELCQQGGVKPPRPLLIRKKHTKPLSNFTPRGRVNTLKDAFLCQKHHLVAGKHILLVDDIFTTGATLNACAKVLLAAGAETVTSVTFAVVP